MNHDEEDKRVFDILNKPAKLLSLKELCDLPLVPSHMYMNKEDFDELMKFADAPTDNKEVA